MQRADEKTLFALEPWLEVLKRGREEGGSEVMASLGGWWLGTKLDNPARGAPPLPGGKMGCIEQDELEVPTRHPWRLSCKEWVRSRGIGLEVTRWGRDEKPRLSHPAQSRRPTPWRPGVQGWVENRETDRKRE